MANVVVMDCVNYLVASSWLCRRWPAWGGPARPCLGCIGWSRGERPNTTSWGFEHCDCWYFSLPSRSRVGGPPRSPAGRPAARGRLPSHWNDHSESPVNIIPEQKQTRENNKKTRSIMMINNPWCVSYSENFSQRTRHHLVDADKN